MGASPRMEAAVASAWLGSYLVAGIPTYIFSIKVNHNILEQSLMAKYSRADCARTYDVFFAISLNSILAHEKILCNIRGTCCDKPAAFTISSLHDIDLHALFHHSIYCLLVFNTFTPLKLPYTGCIRLSII